MRYKDRTKVLLAACNNANMSNMGPKGLIISWLVLGVLGQPKGYYLTRLGE